MTVMQDYHTKIQMNLKTYGIGCQAPFYTSSVGGKIVKVQRAPVDCFENSIFNTCIVCRTLGLGYLKVQPGRQHPWSSSNHGLYKYNRRSRQCSSFSGNDLTTTSSWLGPCLWNNTG